MWPNLQETADSVTFTEEIFNGNIYFLCNDKRLRLFCKNFDVEITKVTPKIWKYFVPNFLLFLLHYHFGYNFD